MNIILIDSSELKQSQVVLDDYRAEHIVKIIRAGIGDILKIGVVNGAIGKGKILEIQKKYPFYVRMEIQFQTHSTPVAEIDLLLALPRPIMLKRILSQVTALGVRNIYLVNANRVEKSFWEAGILHLEEINKHLLQGLEQCVDTRLPKVHIHKRFKPFIEDYLPRKRNAYATMICAHPKGEYNLVDGITSGQGRILFAIGPEGGWVEYEVQKFIQVGFRCCHFGDRILKVDTSVIAIHGAIHALRESVEKRLAKK